MRTKGATVLTRDDEQILLNLANHCINASFDSVDLNEEAKKFDVPEFAYKFSLLLLNVYLALFFSGTTLTLPIAKGINLMQQIIDIIKSVICSTSVPVLTITTSIKELKYLLDTHGVASANDKVNMATLFDLLNLRIEEYQAVYNINASNSLKKGDLNQYCEINMKLAEVFIKHVAGDNFPVKIDFVSYVTAKHIMPSALFFMEQFKKFSAD